MADSHGPLRIEVEGGADIPPDDIEALTGQLRDDLLELDLGSVDRPMASRASEGAKSGPAHTVGVLIATGLFTASTVKAVATVVAVWIRRTGARSVTIERGESRIEITGASPHQLDVLVERWLSESEREDPQAGGSET